MIVPVRQEGTEYVIRRLFLFKIEEETSSECWWDVFTEEILPRLPTDHLEALKTVCKNWFRIISSPYFVRLHFNNVYNQGQIRVLTLPCLNSAVNMIEYNIDCDDNVDLETKQIPFPQPIRTRVSKILGSCDGLLCLLLVKPNQIGVYNPSTAKYFLVQPSTKYNYTCSWFGHHPSSGEYVLVLWDFSWKVEVYKFSSGSRFTLELIHSTPCSISQQFPPGNIFFYPYEKRGTILNGALHWPALWINIQDLRQLSRRVICTYNLYHNKYSEISIPGYCPSRFKLGVNAEGCLFTIFNNTGKDELEMWVMKEYGVEQSWAKHTTINIVGPYDDSVLLGLFPNGDLILDANRLGLFKYNFNDNKVMRFIKYRDCSRSDAIVCVDSLVSPTIVLSKGETNSCNSSLD